MEPVTIDQLIAFRPEPGDIVVVQLVEKPTLEQAEWVREQLKAALPADVRTFVIHNAHVELAKRWALFTDLELEAVRSMPADDDVVGGEPVRDCDVQRLMAAEALVELNRRRS